MARITSTAVDAATHRPFGERASLGASTKKRSPKPPRQRQCKMLPATATKAECVAAHKAKMAAKKGEMASAGEKVRNRGVLPASINRRTGKPHEHKREIARRQGREG